MRWNLQDVFAAPVAGVFRRYLLFPATMTVAALFMAGPVLVALVSLLIEIPGDSSAALAESLALDARILRLLTESTFFAMAVATGGLLLGVLMGMAVWHARSPWPGRLRWVLLALLAVPSYVHALAWGGCIGRCNRLLAELELPALPEQGWGLACLVQTMTLAPLAVGGCMLALELVDGRLVRAARPLRRDLSVTATVILPQAAPMLLAVWALLFLLSIGDYSVPSLFQTPVYAMHIFAVFSAQTDTAQAFLAAVPLLGVTAVVLLFSFKALRRLRCVTLPQQSVWTTPPVWPTWFCWLLWLVVGFAALQILVPAVELAVQAGSWQAFSASVSLAEREIVYSFMTSLLAAIVTLPLAWFTAVQLRKHGWAGVLAWILVLLCLATPAPLAGVGLIAIWNVPWLHFVYDSSFMPVLASVTRFAPLAALVFLARDEQAAAPLLQVARVFQRSGWQTWWRIRLPLALPVLLAAAGLIFALSLGELGATLLVAPPGKATLTMRIYNYLHYGGSETVAGLSLFVAAMAACLGLFTLAALRWNRRLGLVGTRF